MSSKDNCSNALESRLSNSIHTGNSKSRFQPVARLSHDSTRTEQPASESPSETQRHCSVLFERYEHRLEDDIVESGNLQHDDKVALGLSLE